MGRPRKASAIHEITGAKAKNPARFLDREEPETTGPIGDPPPEFMPTVQPGRKDEAGNWIEHPGVYDPKDRRFLRELWTTIANEAPIGVLTASDRQYLKAICKMGLLAEDTHAKGYRQALKEFGLMMKGIGMTPDGRAIRGLGGKAAATKKAANPLGDFVARRRAS
jgi:hypothetical protein